MAEDEDDNQHYCYEENYVTYPACALRIRDRILRLILLLLYWSFLS